MEEFYIGQIFENVYPSEAAQWCNDGGDCYIKEIDSVDGVRRFEIVVNPQVSEEDLKDMEISEIKAKLEAIDLKSIRAIRANELSYIEDYEQEALELRTRLKELTE